jgi:hypothetical protein
MLRATGGDDDATRRWPAGSATWPRCVRMSVAVTARLAAGESPAVEAALIKDLGTEFEQLIPMVEATAAPTGRSTRPMNCCARWPM